MWSKVAYLRNNALAERDLYATYVIRAKKYSEGIREE